jgi:hypothetical protein
MPDIHPVTQVAFVICVCLIILLAIIRKVPFSLRGGPVTIDVSVAKQLEQIQTDVAKINSAVNNVPKGDPTLISRVERIEELQQWQVGAIQQMAAHVGSKIAEPPPDRRKADEPRRAEP